MRASIAIISILLFSQCCFAQSENLSIIQDAMRRWQDSGTLVYLRAELSFSSSQETLMRGKLLGGDEETRMNKLILSKADKDIITDKQRSRRRASWADSLFENSKGLIRDTLQAILYDKERGWSYFHQHIGKGYFQFSEPLLIQNGLCTSYPDSYGWTLCWI